MPAPSTAAAYPSAPTICSGVCLLPFIRVPSGPLGPFRNCHLDHFMGSGHCGRTPIVSGVLCVGSATSWPRCPRTQPWIPETLSGGCRRWSPNWSPLSQAPPAWPTILRRSPSICAIRAGFGTDCAVPISWSALWSNSAAAHQGDRSRPWRDQLPQPMLGGPRLHHHGRPRSRGHGARSTGIQPADKAAATRREDRLT